MRNRGVKTIAYFLSAILAVSSLPLGIVAQTETKSYRFFGENPGGSSAYAEFGIEADEAVVVWINGGKSTYENGAIVDHKNKLVNLYEYGTSSGYYNITKSKGIVWGASSSPTPPTLVKGKYKDISAKQTVKISKGKTSPVKTPGTSYIHAYKTQKVLKTIESQYLSSFRVDVKVAPSKLEAYSDPEFKTKSSKETIGINGETAVYVMPTAGSSSSPLTVDDETRYLVSVTKFPEYVSLSKTSVDLVDSSGDGSDDPQEESPAGQSEGNNSSGDIVSSIEMTYQELIKGFYVRGVASKSDTADGTSTITVTCLNNGKKKTYSVTVKKPDVDTSAEEISLLYSKGTVTYSGFGTTNQVELSSSGATDCSGLTQAEWDQFVEDFKHLPKNEMNANIGEESQTTITAKPVDSKVDVTYSIISGATGSVTKGVYNVKMTKTDARVKVTLKHGKDTSAYYLNITSSAPELIGAIPAELSIRDTGGSVIAELTDKEIESLNKTSTITTKFEMDEKYFGNLTIVPQGGLTIIQSGTPEDDEVLITIKEKNTSQQQRGSINTPNTASGSLKSQITLVRSSYEIVVTMQTANTKSTFNIMLRTNYYVDTTAGYMYFGGSRSANFTKYGEQDTDPDDATGNYDASYYTTVQLSRTTDAYTKNQKISVIEDDAESQFKYAYKLIENCEAGNGDDKVSIKDVNNKKQAIFYVTVSPVNASAIDYKTGANAEEKTYKITVKWG